MRLFSWGLVVGSLLVACGSEGGVSAPEPDGGPLGTPGSGSPTSDGSSDGAAITDGGGAGDADASPKDNRIDPVEVGRSWTYDVTVIGFFPACDNGKFSATALSRATIDGKSAIRVESFCKGAGAYDYSIDGDRVYSYLASAWRTSLDAPVVAGHSWTDGFLEYRWDAKGTVTTPAGTFSDCWSATTIASYTSYIVLCRGVGPVKWHYETGLGNGYEAILTAKNF